MKRTCENCSKPIFDTDTVCWHCGHKQSLTTKPSPAFEQPKTNSVIEDEIDTEPEPIAAKLVLYYGGLTAVIAVALLLTIRSLGHGPIVTFDSNTSQGEWLSIISPDRSFTIDIPATWEWQFLEEPASNIHATDMLEIDSPIKNAVNPLGNLVSDIEYLLVAQSEDSLLVIARSERLGRLTARQAVASLQTEQFENLTVIEARLIQEEAGAEKAFFTVEHMDIPLQCDQFLVPASSDSYVLAACTLAEKHTQQSAGFRKTLDSFSAQSR